LLDGKHTDFRFCLQTVNFAYWPWNDNFSSGRGQGHVKTVKFQKSRLNATGSHVHCKIGNVTETMQDRDVYPPA